MILFCNTQLLLSLLKTFILDFESLNLDPYILDGLDAMNFFEATPIQELAIPKILAGKDLIACAQTGTGKTAAYLLPVIHKMLSKNIRRLNTLILAPTRELAQQIDQQIEGLGYFTGVSSIPIYGGGDGISWVQQKRALDNGAEIIVATPGRLLAQIQSGGINFEHLEHLILDEADRMLDMGFIDDIKKIISFLPKQRQTLMFSATMAPKIKQLAAQVLINPEEIILSLSKPAEGIAQRVYFIEEAQKVEMMKHLLKEVVDDAVIVFASTKEKVKSLGYDLKKAGFSIKAFHSGLVQAERDEIMLDFKNNKIKILVGTDVLSRGIDIENINMVVNYDIAPDAEDYVHRIGRTARAERKGTAVSLISQKDLGKLRRIESLIGYEIEKFPLPESIGETPDWDYKNPPKRDFAGGSGKRPKKKNWRKPS